MEREIEESGIFSEDTSGKREKSKGKGQERKSKSKGKRQKAKMAERQDLDERLLEYGARIVKLVESLPKFSSASELATNCFVAACLLGPITKRRKVRSQRVILFANYKPVV